jgi:hypothetical protein
MTPTFPDDYDLLRSSGAFRPINTQRSERDKMEELRNKINQHLDRKGIVNPQIRLELIKIIIEEQEEIFQ